MMMRARAAIVVASVLFTLGCGGGGGSADAGPQGGGGMGGSGAGGTGTGGAGGTSTGGAGGTSSIDPAPFIATWTETAMINVSGACGNATLVSSSGPIAVTAGTSSDLLRAEPTLNGCSIPLDIVTSTSATLARTVQCATSNGTYEFTTWTMSLDNGTASESASGTVTLPSAATCPINLTTTLTR